MLSSINDSDGDLVHSKSPGGSLTRPCIDLVRSRAGSRGVHDDQGLHHRLQMYEVSYPLATRVAARPTLFQFPDLPSMYRVAETQLLFYTHVPVVRSYRHKIRQNDWAIPNGTIHLINLATHRRIIRGQGPSAVEIRSLTDRLRSVHKTNERR